MSHYPNEDEEVEYTSADAAADTNVSVEEAEKTWEQAEADSKQDSDK